MFESKPGSMLINYVPRDWSQTFMTEYIWRRNYSGIKLYFCWVVKISKLPVKQYDVLLCNVISRNHQTDSHNCHNCLIDDITLKIRSVYPLYVLVNNQYLSPRRPSGFIN